MYALCSTSKAINIFIIGFPGTLKYKKAKCYSLVIKKKNYIFKPRQHAVSFKLLNMEHNCVVYQKILISAGSGTVLKEHNIGENLPPCKECETISSPFVILKNHHMSQTE